MIAIMFRIRRGKGKHVLLTTNSIIRKIPINEKRKVNKRKRRKKNTVVTVDLFLSFNNSILEN